MEIKNKYLYYLGLLIIAGAILRLYNLGYNSLWLDEATTYTISSQSFLGIWQSMINGEFNPPLFYWIEHIILWFGNSEILLRIVPAIFGILTIPVFYFIGKEFLNDKIGIVMATIATFSPFLILYSQEARAYSTMLFFVSLSILYYLKATKTNNYKLWIIFGLISAISLWVHFYSLIIIAPLLILSMFFNYKKSACGVIAFFILSLPLFIEGINLFVLKSSSQSTFTLHGVNIITGGIYQISGFNWAAIIIFATLFIIGVSALGDIDKKLPIVLITISILITSFVLSYIIPMQPRYLIILIPFFYLGIASFFRLIKTKIIIYAVLIILMLIGTPFLYSYYTTPIKDDWRGFAGILYNNTNDGDNIIIIPGYVDQPLNYYYNSTLDKTTEYKINSVRELGQLNIHGRVVITNDASPDIREWIENKTNLGLTYGNIYLYDI